ncbi:hypothetical protein LBMAG46_17580 [Planctomycetia bacterium]|nr:hypothetical protein LBMAG46_17580 [Planctomycetia bacterium]
MPCLAHDFGDVAIDDHVAFFNHSDSRTHVCQFRQDMAADDDSFAHLSESSEEISDFDAGAGVQSAGGLIQQQHLRVVQQCAGQSDALSLSAGQFVDHGIAFEGHIDKFKFFFNDFAPSLGNDAIGGGEEFEVFHDGHIVVDAEEVGHEADQSADFFLVCVDGFSADVGFTVIGREECGDHPHGGGFARPVGSDETKHVTFLQSECDVIGGDEAAVAFCEVSSFDHGRVRGAGPDGVRGLRLKQRLWKTT